MCLKTSRKIESWDGTPVCPPWHLLTSLSPRYRDAFRPPLLTSAHFFLAKYPDSQRSLLPVQSRCGCYPLAWNVVTRDGKRPNHVFSRGGVSYFSIQRLS